MRLPIFWRVILAQISLIALILLVSLYALSQLYHLTDLTTAILSRDSVTIDEEKRLLKLFFTQMRNAEKYVHLQDPVYYTRFSAGTQEFHGALEQLAPLLESPAEQDLLRQIQDMHSQYATALSPTSSPSSVSNTDRTELSDAIAAGIDGLIRLREEGIAHKTAEARDQGAFAARVVGWLTAGGIGIAVLLAYVHARGVSRPLRILARELRQVGRGDFLRSLELRAPREVDELARAFNWMAHRLAKLDAMKADFIAHISHEFRTPLTAIQEGTSLLWEEISGPLTDSQREILTAIRRHSERLSHHLSSILDLSKMEAGMMEYILVPSDLTDVIQRSVEAVRLVAQKKRIPLEVLLSSPLPRVSLDVPRMQQVFDNLLSNAVKFTPEEGHIKVSATHETGEDSQRGWVEVRVSDTGIGIAPEELERVFDKFYQSPQQQRNGPRGTGLGLAIVRHIVEAHDGKIWVESRVGQGSTFIVLLPVDSSKRVEPVAIDSPQSGAGNVA